MAQLFRKGIRLLQPLPPHPDDQRALERIKYELSEWDQLNWYVQFTGKELNRLTAGDFLSVKEEMRAVERTEFRRMMGHESLPELTDDEVQQHYSLFRERLIALADAGMVSFDLPETVLNFNYLGWGEHPAGRSWLDFHFAKLLKRFSVAVLRCPNTECNKIFIKTRGNANYCSRQCQNRMAMRTIRKRAKQETARGKRKPKAEKTTAQRFEEIIRKDRKHHGNKAN